MRQQARRFLDRLVGYKLSPILWKKVRRGLSAGRVQSVAVRLIVEREREIEAFKPVEYWQIKVQVETEKGEKFEVELARVKGKKAEIHDGEKAKVILAELENANYVVTNVKKIRTLKRHRTHHLRPRLCNRPRPMFWGGSAKKTMNVAQKLYEQGDITYHRTDSFNLVPAVIEDIRKFVGEKYGPEYLPTTPRLYKTGGKVVAQEAHEAVRPTHIEVSPDKFVGQEMAHDQEKMYSLIWRRTVGCQMADALFDDTKIVVTAGENELTTTGGNHQVRRMEEIIPQGQDRRTSVARAGYRRKIEKE